MPKFNEEKRTEVFERILEIAKADDRVTGGALVGSLAKGGEDEWSDIDITFGINTGVEPKMVLEEWTVLIKEEFTIVHFFDVLHASAIYRVFLFSNGLELDLSVVPENDYGPKSAGFQLLFGKANEKTIEPNLSPGNFIGWGWHHIMHTNSAINRRKKWQAEFWLNSLRNYIIAWKCSRLGLPSNYARGADGLPKKELEELERTLVASLDFSDLGNALEVIAVVFVREVGLLNEKLAQQLKAVFQMTLTE